VSLPDVAALTRASRSLQVARWPLLSEIGSKLERQVVADCPHAGFLPVLFNA
jgi:hypothetical protein